MQPIRAYHLILTAYGFWLPNDPRGSWSDFVRSWELLLDFGPATRTTQRESVARTPHDRDARFAAKRSLHRRPVVFTGLQAHAIAEGFARYIRKSNVVIHACSILPTHVHLVVKRHRNVVETLANLMKGAATTALRERGLHPFEDQPYHDGTIPTPWTRKPWKVFLTTDEDIVRAIDYVERNPIKDGKARQRWSFVVPFEGGT